MRYLICSYSLKVVELTAFVSISLKYSLYFAKFQGSVGKQLELFRFSLYSVYSFMLCRTSSIQLKGVLFSFQYIKLIMQSLCYKVEEITGWNLNQPQIVDRLKQYRFVICNDSNRVWKKDNQAEISIININRQGSVIHYSLIFLHFVMHIAMFNLSSPAPQKRADKGKGNFGRLRTEFFGDKPIVAKRQYFITENPNNIFQGETANREQIEQKILQVAIAKIFSFFEIGPKFITQLGFDLLCYSDCTEFFMEVCHPASDQQILNSGDSLFKDLKKIHQFGLIHKDIKPSNIMYSPSLQKTIFIDFGISHFIRQSKFEKSLTKFEGTPRYMGADLLKLRGTDQPGLVDLRKNDHQQLMKTLEVCQQRIKKNHFFHRKYKESTPDKIIRKNFDSREKVEGQLNLNYLQLVFRYSTFGIFKINTSESWLFLDSKKLNEIVQSIILTSNKQTIVSAIEDIKINLHKINSNKFQKLVSQLQSKLKGIIGPQFVGEEEETQLSLRYKLRVYDYSPTILAICSRIQTQSEKKSLILSFVEKNLLGGKEQNIKKQHQNQVRKTQLQVKKPADFLNILYCAQYYLYYYSTATGRDERRRIIDIGKSVIKLFNISFYCVKTATLSLLDVIWRYTCSQIDDQSRWFQRFYRQLWGLAFKTQQLWSDCQALIALMSGELLKRNQSLIILKYLEPLHYSNCIFSTIKFQHQISYSLSSQISSILFIYGKYDKAIFYAQDINARNQKKIFSTLFYHSLGSYNLKAISIATQCYISLGRIHEALTSERQLLKFGLATYYSPSVARDIFLFQIYVNLSIIYSLLELKRVSNKMKLKSQRLRESIKKLRKQQTNFMNFNILKILAFSDAYLFETKYHQFKKQNIKSKFICDDEQAEYNLMLSWAFQVLKRGFLDTSLRLYSLAQIFTPTKWNIEKLIEYSNTLVTNGKVQQARKIISSTICNLKQPFGSDFFVLNSLWIKTAGNQVRKVLQVMKFVLIKSKQIPNSQGALTNFLQMSSLWCYKYGLVKKSLQYGKRLLGLKKFQQNQEHMYQIKVFLSKAYILNSQYNLAAQTLKKLHPIKQNIRFREQIYQLQSYVNIIINLNKSQNFLNQKAKSKTNLTARLLDINEFIIRSQNQKILESKHFNGLKSDNHIGKQIFFQTNEGIKKFHDGRYRQSMVFFTCAAKLCIKMKGIYWIHTAASFARIGESLIRMDRICEGISYCSLAYFIFRSLKIRPSGIAAYSSCIRLIKKYQQKLIPFIDFSTSIQNYIKQVQSLLKMLTQQQHRMQYSLKEDIYSLLICNQNLRIQQARIRIQIFIHLKMLGQFESALQNAKVTWKILSNIKQKQAVSYLKKLLLSEIIELPPEFKGTIKSIELNIH